MLLSSFFYLFRKSSNSSRPGNHCAIVQQQRRSLFYAKSSCCLCILIGEDLPVDEPSFIQIIAGNSTIWTGCRSKQNGLLKSLRNQSGFMFLQFLIAFGLRTPFICPVFSFCVEPIFAPVLVFLGFAGIPVLNRTVISGDSTVYLGGLPACRADEVLSSQISVILANRIRWGYRVIWKAVILRNLSDKTVG